MSRGIQMSPRFRKQTSSRPGNGWTRHLSFCYSSACRPDERRNFSIMRTPSFFSDHLREFLRVQKIATLPELKQALGTSVDITVFSQAEGTLLSLQLFPPWPLLHPCRDPTVRSPGPLVLSGGVVLSLGQSGHHPGSLPQRRSPGILRQ